MHTTTLTIAFGLLGMGMPLLSAGQFQITNTGTFSNQDAVITCVLTTDDGMITAHPENGGFLVRKYAPTGTLLWNRFMQDTNAGAMPWMTLTGNICRDATGGAFLAIALQSVEVDLDNVDPDTTLCRVLVAHVLANGDIDARIVARTIVDANAEPYDLNVASFDGTKPTVSVTYDDASGPNLVTEILSFDDSLTPEFAWNIGRSSTDNIFPGTEPADWDRDRSLAFTSNGELVYARTEGFGDTYQNLVKLSSTGDVQWARKYYYSNTLGGKFTGIALDANDRIHSLAWLWLPSGYFVFIASIDPDGQLHEASLYQTPFFTQAKAQIHMTSDGRRVVHGLGNTMICDTLGSVAPIQHAIVRHIGDLDFHGEWNVSDLYNDQFCTTGNLIEQHSITNFTNLYQSALRMGIDQLGTCMHFPTWAEHFDVPVSGLVQEDLMDVQSTDVLALYTAGPPNGITITDPTPALTTDLCEFVVGVDEDLSNANGQLLRSNLVAAGTALSLTRPVNGRIEVTDMSGRTVRTVTINGSTKSLSSSGWAAGVYLLRAINTNGRVMGTQRVVIE